MSQAKELKRIADSLEKLMAIYDDPTAWMERIGRGVSEAASQLNIPAPILPDQTVTPGVAVAAIELKLTEEERKAICEQAMADIEAQMEELRGFIAQSLSELGEVSLKRIGDLMAQGKKFKIRRRHGCIYLDFGEGDDDFYLRM